MTPYNRLFGLRSLNGRVEAFASPATDSMLFTSKFKRGRTLAAEDGTLEWDELTFGRGLAPVTGHKARFPNMDPLTIVNRKSAVAHLKRSKVLDPYKLWYERLPGTLRPGAAAYVELELRDMVNEINRTVEYMAAESLRGTLTVNAANIPGSSQAFTLTYSPNTYTASAGWATATTGILSSEIPAMKIDFEQTCGLSPRQVIIGSTVEGYMTGNTEITTLARTQLGERLVTQTGVMNGPLLGGLQVGNLDWTITEGGYVPAGGSFTRYLPTTDEAIALPADNELPDVLGMASGRGMIPAQEFGPASAAANLLRPAPSEGFYSYAKLTEDGHAVKLFVGWVGLPVVLRPQAVSVLNLVP